MNMMRKMAITGFFTLSMMLSFTASNASANANGIVVDGNYNDWNGQYQKVQANSDAQRNVGIWADQNNIYFIWIRHQTLSIIIKEMITVRI